jgi:hypothetical protein
VDIEKGSVFLSDQLVPALWALPAHAAGAREAVVRPALRAAAVHPPDAVLAVLARLSQMLQIHQITSRIEAGKSAFNGGSQTEPDGEVREGPETKPLLYRYRSTKERWATAVFSSLLSAKGKAILVSQQSV